MELQNQNNTTSAPSEKIALSVFIPFYNEEQNIRASIEGLLKTLETQDRVLQFEIIVINDGSTDGTGRIAQELTHAHETVRVVTHETNKGYGAALVSGFQNAQYEYVFFTDGDLQFNPDDLVKLLVYIPAHAAVIGYRERRRDSFVRVVYATGWNILNRIVFGLYVKDINCAFKLFRRDDVKHMTFLSQGAMLSSELLIRLRLSGVVFKQVPVEHLPRIYGKPTGGNIAVVLKACHEFIMLFRSPIGKHARVRMGVLTVLFFCALAIGTFI